MKSNKKWKRLATLKEQAKKDFKCMEEPNWDFEQKPGTQMYPRLKDNADSRSN
jgi:hypothetical protein